MVDYDYPIQMSGPKTKTNTIMLAVQICAMVLLVVVATEATSCKNCGSGVECPRLSCKGGMAYDPCSCCDMCLPGLGEQCPGMKCDDGLECKAGMCKETMPM